MSERLGTCDTQTKDSGPHVKAPGCLNWKPIPLSAEEIVERGERRWRIWRETLEFIGWTFAICLFVVLNPFVDVLPHLEFVAGVFVGMAIQAVRWGRWRWKKGDRP